MATIRGKQIAKQTIEFGGIGNGHMTIKGDFDMGTNVIKTSSSVFSDLDLVNKYYVDNFVAGLHPKDSCRVATSGNISYPISGLLVIDNYQTKDHDRVLIKNQIDPIQNGIYLASAGTWMRSPDLDGHIPDEVSKGTFTFIETGTTYSTSQWFLTSPTATGSTIIPDVDQMVWIQFGGGGLYIADDQGITLVGNEFRLALDGNSLYKSPTGLKISSGVTDIISSTSNSVSIHEISISNISNTLIGVVYSLSAVTSQVSVMTITLSNVSSSLTETNLLVSGQTNSISGISYSLSNVSTSLSNDEITLGNVSTSLGNVSTSMGNVSSSLDSISNVFTPVISGTSSILSNISTSLTDVSGGLNSLSSNTFISLDSITISITTVLSGTNSVVSNISTSLTNVSTSLGNVSTSLLTLSGTNTMLADVSTSLNNVSISLVNVGSVLAGSGLTYTGTTLNIDVDNISVKISNNKLKAGAQYIQYNKSNSLIYSGYTGSTGIYLNYTPINTSLSLSGDGLISAKLNGLEYKIDYNGTNGVFYFINNPPIQGDELYFNGSYANFQLDLTDDIILQYIILKQ